MGSRVASSEMLERPPRGLLQRLLRRGNLLAMNIFGDQGSNFHLLVRDPSQETTINVGRIVGLRLLKESLQGPIIATGHFLECVMGIASQLNMAQVKSITCEFQSQPLPGGESKQNLSLLQFVSCVFLCCHHRYLMPYHLPKHGFLCIPPLCGTVSLPP